MRPQRRQQRGHLGRAEDLGERARHPHQRHLPTAATPTTSRQATRHRVRGDRRIAPGDQVRVEARDRRQATGDRAGRQPELAIADPDNRAVATLVGDEGEHIRCDHTDRVLVDEAEARLQIMGDHPQRVRPGPPRDEQQVRVDKRIAQRVPGLPTRGQGSDQAREHVHPSMLQPTCGRHGDATWITRVLGGR